MGVSGGGDSGTRSGMRGVAGGDVAGSVAGVDGVLAALLARRGRCAGGGRGVAGVMLAEALPARRKVDDDDEGSVGSEIR